MTRWDVTLCNQSVIIDGITGSNQAIIRSFAFALSQKPGYIRCDPYKEVNTLNERRSEDLL